MKTLSKQKALLFMRCCFFIVIFCLMANHSFALKPVHKNSLILLEVEHPDDGYRTYYKAVVSGAEMWLNQNYDLIMNYLKAPGSYYARIPTYGPYRVRVTAWKLTSLLYRVPELKARGWQDDVRWILYSALLDDRYYGPDRHVGKHWDPYYDWKWRSLYMEARLITPTMYRANCFGTADYLTKGWEWVDAYPFTSKVGSKFPFVMLYGSENESSNTTHSIDRELKGQNFKYAGSGSRSNLWKFINCFDILRWGERNRVNL